MAFPLLVGLAVACTSSGVDPAGGPSLDDDGGVTPDASASQPDGAPPPDGGADAGAEVSLLTNERGEPLPVLDAPADVLAGDVDVVGIVVDSVSAAAIEGATVRVGGVEGTTDADGRFALKAPRGHALLSARAPGHASVIRQVGLGDRDAAFELALAPHAESADVGPGGRTFSSVEGGALEIPPGAYPTPKTMAVTFVDDPHAMSGDVMFSLADGRAARVLSLVDVEVAAQPASAVTLRLPVPVGVDPARLALYTLDEQTGAWTERVAPTSVADGMATYSVTHFSNRAQVEEGSDALAVVTFCDRRRYTSDGLFIGGGACLRGKPILRGETIRPNGNAVQIQLRNGGRVTLGGDAVEHSLRDDDPSAEVALDSTCATEPCSTEARYSGAQPKTSGKYKFLVRPRNTVVMGVRGTVFSWASHPCGGAESAGRASGELAVNAGAVDIQSAGAAKAVEAGVRLRVCLGCSSPDQVACCYQFASQPPCGGACEGPSYTWVCDDLKRYVCLAGGGCATPPAGPASIGPVKCGGDDHCPYAVPRCRRAPEGLVYEGTCMPEAPIAQFGWNQYVVPVDPVLARAP